MLPEDRPVPTFEPPDLSPSERVFAYLELMRLPNLFTAMADVVMGFLVTHEAVGGEEGWVLGVLVAASCLLYAGGVVLNDVFDFSIDGQLRPGRPLPSGRVTVAAARRLGWTLLAAGTALGWVAGLLAGYFWPGVVASLLAGCVILYDGALKRTPLGPVAMGACRMLNVLLGISAIASPWQIGYLLAAAGIGTYIVGVTWFARHEAEVGGRAELLLAILVMWLGIGLLAWFPTWTDEAILLIQTDPSQWYSMVAILGALIGWQCFRVVLEPYPDRVRLAVKQCILSLVILDAVACYAIRGTSAALVVVLFLIPTILLGRWISST